MRIVIAAAGVLILGFAGFVAWLLWPLPTSEFDWEAQVDVYLDTDECREAVSLAASVWGLWQDEVALERLRRISEGENCPNGSLYVLPETTSRFSEELGNRIFVPSDQLGFANLLSRTFERYQFIQRARNSVEGVVINFTDLATVFRCERLTADQYEAEWRIIWDALPEDVRRSPSALAWDRREEECYARIERELARLGPQLEEGTDARYVLILSYQDLAEEIERPGAGTTTRIILDGTAQDAPSN